MRRELLTFLVVLGIVPNSFAFATEIPIRMNTKELTNLKESLYTCNDRSGENCRKWLAPVVKRHLGDRLVLTNRMLPTKFVYYMPRNYKFKI